MRALYEPFTRNHDRLIVMDIRSSELTKYAANAMLATKISFMNELANIAERVGADIEKVRIGIGSDPRIGYSFIYPGTGYGGSCFPKDVQALIRSAHEVGHEPQILDAVEAVNDRQKEVLVHKMQRHFSGELKGRTRRAVGSGLQAQHRRHARGARGHAHRAAAEGWCQRTRLRPGRGLPRRRACSPAAPASRSPGARMRRREGADALAIVTEWQEFRSPDFDRLKEILKAPVIFDGRNLYDPAMLARFGLTYYAIGRGKPLPQA